MAKLDRPRFGEWYGVAHRWVDAAFAKGDSLFTPGRRVWTTETLNDLYHRYVENFDEGDDDFRTKLQKQLESASPETMQLMAEVLYGYYLPMVGNLKPTTKIDAVQWLLNLIKPPIVMAEELQDAFSIGIARESRNYIQQRYYQLKLIIEVAREWWKLNDAERAQLLKDPWAFKGFLAQLPAYNNNAARQMLLYFVHPDSFEPIMADSDKQAIAWALASDYEKKIADDDRRLLAIRERMTAQRKAGFSFYEGDLKHLWKPSQVVAEDEDEPTNETPITPVTEHRCWKIAPGQKARLWTTCLEKGIICIGWNKLGDLRSLDRAAFDTSIPKVMNEHGYRKGCRVVWTFAKKIKKGDIIVANKGTSQVLGIGKVTGDYYFDSEAEYAHCIPVDWYDTSPKAVNFSHWVGTLKRVSPEDYQAILAGAPGETVPATDHARAFKTAVLDEPPGIQPDYKLITLLLDRMNVVLHGPPGTGKTYATLHVADLWKTWQGSDCVSQVTFHPSYAYEDFIEGFRPDSNGRFTLQPGLFVKVCDAARKSPKRKFLLIIDELNRGDVARIFGELITLIERDKRSDRAARLLPYSRRPFHAPANLFLLGTMNTADRSISLLDIAIRRRFCFMECSPDAAVIEGSEQHHQIVEGIDLAKLMLSLNGRLQAVGVERDRAVGHSHFLIERNGIAPLTVLRSRIRHDIVPLIEEYCYANRSQMASVLGSIVRADGVVADHVLDDDARLIDVLTKLCQPSA